VQNDPVFKRDRSLLAEIERGALDDRVSLVATLRRCIALGHQTHSAEVREWATRELHGYRNDSEIPEYRIIHVPLMINGSTLTHRITGEQISATDLPDFVQEHISEELRLAHSVGDLQALVRNAERANKTNVMMVPLGAAEVVKMMNHLMQDRTRVVTNLYWDVSTARIEGVLEQIRTKLVGLASEMRAVMTDDASVPSSEQADQAVNFVLNGGRRNTINVISSQTGTGGTSTVTTNPAESTPSFSTRGRLIGTFIVGLATVIATIVGIAQYAKDTGPSTPRPTPSVVRST